MHPRLVEIPFLNVTIWGFGAMMALGFLAALGVVRRLSRRAGLDPETVSNAALYCLFVGVVGARTFFVIHHIDRFRGDVLSVFAIWRGGLEFLGGVAPAVGFLLFYLRFRRLPMRRYLDILAIGLMMGLAFGRLGCFLNGCCYGQPTELPWAVRFPYGSYAFVSQANPDPQRGRTRPHLQVPPPEYAAFYGDNGRWYPKSLDELTEPQRHEVTKGEYRCLPVHPTQLYASAYAFLLCALLYLLWRRGTGSDGSDGLGRRFAKPGMATAALCLLYGPGRIALEAIRDDNPYELGMLTISQLLGIAMFLAGLVLLAVLVTGKHVVADESVAV
jgi:phosphatidylglycerol:prolipoprotein diacylglycerol transferase